MLIIPHRTKPEFCNIKCPCCYFDGGADEWKCCLLHELKDTRVVHLDVTEYAEQAKRHPKCPLIGVSGKEFEKAIQKALSEIENQE